MTLLSALAGAAVVPAASAAETCNQAADGPRYKAWVETAKQPGVRRTSLVRCDLRAGTKQIVRRGRAAGNRGTELVHAFASGRRLAWIERRLSRSGASLTLRTADAGSLKVKQRRVLRRGASARTVDAAVIVNAWDDLVWSVGSRLWSRRAGGPVVSRGRGSARQAALLGDYVVVGARRNGIRLRPPIVRNGCPWRPSAITIAASGPVTVSRVSAAYGGEETVEHLMCDRETGRETTVNSSSISDPDYDFHDAVDVAAITGRYVLLVITGASGHSFYAPNLQLLDARTGATVRTAAFGEWPSPSSRTVEAVLAEDGSFAWVGAHPLRRELRLARPGAEPVTLDAGFSEPIGLALAARTLTWTNAGVARSYVLP